MFLCSFLVESVLLHSFTYIFYFTLYSPNHSDPTTHALSLCFYLNLHSSVFNIRSFRRGLWI